jgi:Tol biopolymer transport system component
MSSNVACSQRLLRRVVCRAYNLAKFLRQSLTHMTTSRGPIGDELCAPPAGDRFDSWKEIAAYLNREVRTVQRWEKTESLPIHRLPHEKRGSVFAFRSELDEWMDERERRGLERVVPAQGPPELVGWPDLETIEETYEADARTSKSSLARVSFLGFALLVLLTCGLVSWRFIEARRTPPRHVGTFDSTRISRFTDTGKTKHAVITPDGKYVVRADQEHGKISFWVRQVATARDVQILPPSDQECWGITITPDSNYIYTVLNDRSGPIGELYEFPLLGGPLKKIVRDVDGPVSFSPDGKRIAYTRADPTRNPVQSYLLIANADGTDERALVTFEAPYGFSGGGPAWSPDSNAIAFGHISFFENKMHLMAADASTGKISQLSPHEWRAIGRVAWITGGNDLVVQATDFDASRQIWIVQRPKGNARRLTNDIGQYSIEDVSLTADSRTLLVVQDDIYSHIWVAGAGVPHQVSSGAGRHDGVAGLDWTSQNEIVYATAPLRASGELWIMDSNGSRARPLTANGAMNQYPAVSPDGHSVVFSSTARGNSNLWAVNTDGSGLKRLTSGNWEMSPSVSPDGKWIMYASAPSGNTEIQRIGWSEGEPKSVVTEPSFLPRISPNGKFVAYLQEEGESAQYLIRLIPFEGGNVIQTFRLPILSFSDFFTTPVQWAPDGKALTYVKTVSGVSNIWSQSLDRTAPKQITRYSSDQIFWFAWSRDGKHLVLARGNTVGDAVLLQEAP